MPQKQKVLVIVGPTAAGKSTLAVKLAKELNGEVISADSRQVYKGLDIGSGKITKREMRGIRHHLLDVSGPKRQFTASDFLRLAQKAIRNIEKRNKLPIICGGTGFYIDALLGRIQLSEVPPNKALRAKLRMMNASQLYAKLKSIDPKRADTIDRHNPVRLIRALEIAPQQSRKKDAHAAMGARDIINVQWVGIQPEKVLLRQKIHARLLERMKKGMLKEAQKLHKSGLSYKRMKELGLEYRYLALYLQKEITKEEMLKQLESKIWQYSKRQMTYWRRNKDVKWFDSAEKAFDFVLRAIGDSNFDGQAP